MLSTIPEWLSRDEYELAQLEIVLVVILVHKHYMSMLLVLQNHLGRQEFAC